MASVMPEYDAAELINAEQLVLVRGGRCIVVDLPAISHDEIGVDSAGNVLLRVGQYILTIAHVARPGNLPPFPAV